MSYQGCQFRGGRNSWINTLNALDGVTADKIMIIRMLLRRA